jgi:hypothetical protein
MKHLMGIGTDLRKPILQTIQLIFFQKKEDYTQLISN